MSNRDALRYFWSGILIGGSVLWFLGVILHDNADARFVVHVTIMLAAATNMALLAWESVK